MAHAMHRSVWPRLATEFNFFSMILIHSPHRPEKDISYLNINQKITALLAGKAIPNDEKDILVVGTVGSVLAYNVDLNSDLFFKEVSKS
ncbi:hypothetical protein ACI65C_009899 [Semiaphis heraclei]